MYYPEANVLVPRSVDPAVEDAGVQVGVRASDGGDTRGASVPDRGDGLTLFAR